jgi:hypothetical protein
MDIFNEDETTPLSQLYSQNTIKEKPGNTKIGTNQIGAFEKQIKGFQRSKVGIRRKEMSRP